MNSLLILFIVFFLPITAITFEFGISRIKQLLFLEAAIVYPILLCLWATYSIKNANSDLDVLACLILVFALGCLSFLCFEDALLQTVPVIPLIVTILALLGHHYLKIWPEKEIILDDYLTSVVCTTCIWLLAQIFSMRLGRPAMGDADPPLIFALSLGMTPQGIITWITLFSAVALANFMVRKVLFNTKLPNYKQIPLIPYISGAAAIIHTLG